jgi:UDP-N-acetylglucosamine 2-epimerase (non-hydrolysing)
LELAKSKNQVLDRLGISEGGFLLATSHRQENVDNKDRFAGIIKGLQLVQGEFVVPLIYPIHPRARKQLELFSLDTEGLTLVEPLDYLGFLNLESKAVLVLSESFGVQEETCILNVPCVTLRDNTERPETVEVGSNMLAGTSSERILEAAKIMVSGEKSWVNPFGDGKTAQKIINILKKAAL